MRLCQCQPVMYLSGACLLRLFAGACRAVLSCLPGYAAGRLAGSRAAGNSWCLHYCCCCCCGRHCCWCDSLTRPCLHCFQLPAHLCAEADCHSLADSLPAIISCCCQEVGLRTHTAQYNTELSACSHAAGFPNCISTAKVRARSGGLLMQCLAYQTPHPSCPEANSSPM